MHTPTDIRVQPCEVVGRPPISNLTRRYHNAVASLRGQIKINSDMIMSDAPTTCDCCASVSMVNILHVHIDKEKSQSRLLPCAPTTIRICLFCTQMHARVKKQITSSQYEHGRREVARALRDIIDVFAAEVYRRPITIAIIDRPGFPCIICKKLYTYWRHVVTLAGIIITQEICHTCAASIQVAATALSVKHAAYMILAPRELTGEDVSGVIVKYVAMTWTYGQ